MSKQWSQGRSRRRFQELFGRLALLMLCLIVLAACDSGTPPPKKLTKAPADKQTYTIPFTTSADFNTLDPALAHDNDSINAIQMMFTGLVQLDKDLKLHPQLAQSWSVDTDGLTWTFKLKSNLKFSDGNPLTANDVIFSIDRALQPATQSTVAGLYLSLIKDADKLLNNKITTLIGSSLKAPDATTVVIVTRKKAAYFPAMLTMPCSYVVQQSIVQKYGNKFTEHLSEGGSAGPFKVSKYTHNSNIDFVPNENYYNPKPQLQKVSFVFYGSSDDAYRDYMNGKLDMTGVPISTFANDKKRKDFQQVPLAWTSYYTMNYLVKPFDNVNIRQAFALAIDKTAIAQNVWKNTVVPTNNIVPKGIPGYNANLTGPDGTQNLKGDARKALELFQKGLQEQGWNNASQFPQVTLTYASNVPGFEQEVNALIQSWQKTLNITVTAEAVPYETLLDKVTAATNNPNGIQMWGLTWVGEYPDPQDWLSLQFARSSTNNNMNYGQNYGPTAAKQLATQEQLDKADSTMKDTDRLPIYQQAEQQLVNDVAWLPISQLTSTFLRNPNIVGMTDNAQNIIPPDEWANVYRVQ
jgi:peptide/nickel transport system substrate-binding protein/oligopeptide transport system substrate-binding protein